MKKSLLLACAALLAASSALATTRVVQEVNRGYVLKRDAMTIGTPHATEAACWAAADAHAEAAKRSGNYWCAPYKGRRITYTATPACPALPAAETRTTQCTAPQTGSWQQTRTYSAAPAPTCSVPSAWLPETPPAGACTDPAPPPTGTVYYFSDCQPGAAAGCVAGSNSNPGTLASPKRNLEGFNYNAQPAGTTLLFKRGGAWLTALITLNNPNTTAAAPLVFDAYGTGDKPLIRVPSGFTGNMFNLGGNWGNTNNDGGYVIRNLKIDGDGTGDWGFWFVQNVRDVVIENNEVTGFRIAINSNDGTPYGVRGITLRNNNIHHNRAMGLLGHYDDMLIEGNTFEANNFGGSTFDHGTYIGGGNNITLRNNRYVRNSVVDGVCRGGNMTFHGQIDGLLIEGNEIVQDDATDGCWLMSITQGYSSAEWFRNAVVRNNVLKNCGNTCMAAQSAPGILVEGNVVINDRATAQTAFGIGAGPGPWADGDAADANATVRDNVVCRRASGASGAVVSLNSPGGTATNNVLRTGADASTGPCAR